MSLKLLWTAAQWENEASSCPAAFREQGFWVETCPVFLLEKNVQNLGSQPDELNFDQVNTCVFVSTKAVEAVKEKNIQWPKSLQFFAVGASTAQAFKDVFPDRSIAFPLKPEHQHSEGLFDLMKKHQALSGKTLIFRGDSGREWLYEALLKHKVDVEYVSVYRRIVNEEFKRFWRNPSPSFIPQGVILLSTEALNIFLKTQKAPAFGNPWVMGFPGRMQTLAEHSGLRFFPFESAHPASIIAAILQIGPCA